MDGPRQDRWQHLVAGAFALDEGEGDREARVRALLESVLEVFPESIDPVEDFEGYAVRRLALALRRKLGA